MIFISNQIGLYIHIPFCKSKCYYCDFNSYAGRESLVPDYFNALKKEMQLYAEKARDYSVKTIFMGGGTPSLVDAAYIGELMQACRLSFNIEADAEISIETNPGTLSLEKLERYREAGVNRLSIGLQTWQDRLLKRLGRIHSRDEFADNFAFARQAGFSNINVDLIFGIPGQSLPDWNKTVEEILGLDPEHISCYSLKIEEGTVFGKELESGSLIPVEDEIDREMYRLAVESFSKRGILQYEISNFSKKGLECRHNLVYWKAQPYIGLGAGAHSYFEGKRFNNEYALEGYIHEINKEILPRENIQDIGREEAMAEFIILGLRLTSGISGKEFEARFGVNFFSRYREQIQALKGRGLITTTGDTAVLTALGMDLANQVFMEFI